MWKTYRLIFVLLLTDFVTPKRQFKRRENYLSVPPAPAPASAPATYLPAPSSPGSSSSGSSSGSSSSSQTTHQSSGSKASERDSSPYQYEEVHPDEFPLSPPPAPQNHRSHHNYHSSASIQQYEAELSSYHHNGKGSNYLIDNGLRSIAKGSADQALGAVASQNAAGKQAAYVAKSTLAQAAAQAASTAVTALKGKEVLLRRLEEQNIEAHKSLENELAQLHQAKRSAKTAQYSAQQAINHVSVLTAALNNAQAASELAQKSASEAAAELSSQIDMVAQAKTKLEALEGQLYAARLDYEETKEAAEKATLSAQEAQINANDAGAHANVELSDTVGLSHNLHEKSDHLVSSGPDADDVINVEEPKREIKVKLTRNRNRRRNHRN